MWRALLALANITCLSMAQFPSTTSCPDLAYPENGFVFFIFSEAIYGCHSGYRLVGGSSRFCQPDDTWSGEAPTCQEAIACPTLSNPANGNVSAGDLQATYTCNSGFRLVGDSSRTCQADGTWSGEAPLCEVIVPNCPYLDQIPNGEVITFQVTPGFSAIYRCNNGFTPGNIHQRVCQDTGEWDGEVLVCTASNVTCPILASPENGRTVYSGNVPGTEVSYVCDEGFLLVGNETLICQDDGTYDKSPPVCEATDVRCPSLSEPEGNVLTVFGYSPGFEAVYFCNGGSSPSHVLTCELDGMWNPPPPSSCG